MKTIGSDTERLLLARVGRDGVDRALVDAPILSNARCPPEQ